MSAAVEHEVTEYGIDKLGMLSLLSGESKEEWFIKRAPALARLLASYVMPVADAQSGDAINADTGEVTGDTLKARDLGRVAVERDIRRVYLTPSEAYDSIKSKRGEKRAKGWWKLLKFGLLESASLEFQKATGRYLPVIIFDDGKLHQGARNSGGRVSRSTPLAIVSDPKPLVAYIREKQKLVGFAKSGFVNAGKQVAGGQGGRAPAWMSQPAAPGHAVVTGIGTDHFYIEMVDDVSYTSSILDDAYYTAAVEAWDRNLEREAEALAEYQIRKLQLT